MSAPSASTSPPSLLRTYGPRIAAGLVALAVLLALAAALTPLTASTAAGLFVGAIIGGSAAGLAAQRKSRNAQAHRRQADEAALDRLEPLRPDRPS